MPIGLFFGRIANFINGELWGRPTHLPWGMVFCNAHIIDRVRRSLPGRARCRAIRASSTRRRWRGSSCSWCCAGHPPAGGCSGRGLATGVFLVGYGLARFSLEHVREPDSFMPDCSAAA